MLCSPDIPPFATVKPGQVFSVECVDWTGAQIGNNDNSDDIKNVDLTKIHNLSGPVAVEGAMPGDCLVVDILDGAPPSSAKEKEADSVAVDHSPPVR